MVAFAAAQIDAHVEDEHMREMVKQQRERKEEEDREAEWRLLQQEEDAMLRRQAAAYQAWEDWETNAAASRDPAKHPPRRKRCDIELEVASGSGDRVVRRRQVMEVPEEGRLRVKLEATMVDDVLSTIALHPAVGP